MPLIGRRVERRSLDVPHLRTGLFESSGIELHSIDRVGLGERDPFV